MGVAVSAIQAAACSTASGRSPTAVATWAASSSLSPGARRWRCSMDSSRRKTSTGSASPCWDQLWLREVTRMWPEPPCGK
ncbi:hypothetical protein SBADM41S_08906 [Streptomyces badius]